MSLCSRPEKGRGQNQGALGQIFHAFGAAFLKNNATALAAVQHKALRAITTCRTPAMGGHRQRCEHCGHEHVFYHSCRNRHCPRCQGKAQQQWLRERLQESLPVPVFHLVFTLPHELEAVARSNRRRVYSLLLRTAAQTVLTFSSNNRDMRPGIVGVLHTWGQTLIHHPHAHLMVTAGGLSLDGQRWIRVKGGFLFPVKALSRVFRARMLEALHKDALINETLFGTLKTKAWVVFCEGSDSAPDKLLLYLGRYIYRVALQDERIRKIDSSAQTVTFTYKDYARKGRTRRMTLSAFTFIARFLQHILPHGFMKVRYYGLYAHNQKKDLLPRCLALLRQQYRRWRDTLLTLQVLLETIDLTSPLLCPRCRRALMVTIGSVAPDPVHSFRPP